MNKLYYGDNLDVLRRHIDDESVDLVYLDPPFNSNASYNVLFAERDGIQAASQIKAFEDTWKWDDSAARACQEVVESGGKVSEAMQAFRTFLGDSNMMAYLAMMAPRLVELRRVLKPRGSLYLHCDPTSAHYLKMLLDAVFGPQQFRNEVVWKRTSSHANVLQRYGIIQDRLLFYTRGDKWTWNQQYLPYDQEYLDTFFDQIDAEGRRYARRDLTAGMDRASSGQIYAWKGITPPASRCWAMTQEHMDGLEAAGRIHWPKKKGGMPRLKLYPEDLPGVPLGDIWTDVKIMHNLSAERLGYPTQKPVALLERIVATSSNEGDVVLDPFCGCGTTIAAAQKLQRRWIGIDITTLAISLIRHRLADAFGSRAKYEVIGEPVSLPDALKLAHDDPYQFQWWALGLVGARPVEGKRGADKGIDGRIYFHEGDTSKTKQIILSVKAGHVTVSQLRDLRGVLEREKAEIGVLLCMDEPTMPMRKECASAGFYSSPWGKHARLQILTVENLLTGKSIDRPPAQTSITYKRAPKAESTVGENRELFGRG
ncbi:MAG: DNA methyltransferase [Acidobacteria bacterium]|nr:DNA methyltransferase [Acidobacteriota bacterium]